MKEALRYDIEREIAGRTALNIHICRRISGRDLTHVIARTCRLLGKEEEEREGEEEEEEEEAIPTKASQRHSSYGRLFHMLNVLCPVKRIVEIRTRTRRDTESNVS